MARLSVSSEAEVVDAVRAAREGGRTMEIVGHGTKRGLGRPVECDDVLDLSGLSGILKYEPDEMVITALAGTPVVEIEAALAERNQRLGFEPADWGPLYGAPRDSATIGGVLAANANGSAAIRYGRCRDHLLGFRAVNGFGEAYKAGGRVVKNVTGFDLPKLMCGAMGTLGPMTEVTLRVFPKAPLRKTFVVSDEMPTEGFELLRKVASSPLEPTGLGWLPGDLLVRLEGAAGPLDEKIAALRRVLGREPDECADLFSSIADGSDFHDGALDVWRIAILSPLAADFVLELWPPAYCADWAGGLLWIGTEPNDDAMVSRLTSAAAAIDARAVLVRASNETRTRIPPFPTESPTRAELTKRVKAAFDPLRLFNPGRMWDGV
jgi:glycolate oxidase FAD binding subunit